MKTQHIQRFVIHTGFAFAALAALANPATPTASAVFERHFLALGGRESVVKIRTVLVEGTAQEGEQAFGFCLRLQPPGLIELTASNTAGFVVRSGRDARARCWRQDPRGVRDAEPKDAGEFMDMAIGFLLPGQPGLFGLLTNAVCESAQEAGRPALAVGRESTGGPFPRLVFDRETGLLARAGGAAFGDYREVQGVKIPFECRSKGSVRLKAEQIRFNDPIDPAVFERPEKPTAAPDPARLPRERTLLSREGRREIVRRPAPARFGRGALEAMPVYDPKSARHAQVDLRGFDLRGLDLTDRLPDLLRADFDSVTQWPETLPAGFDRERILELGMDPGLGIRTLHRQGITGNGVGVGIIDQPLLVDHREYRERLRLYEEIHTPDDAPAQMHGAAVASIAVGRSVGVAPGADLYFIAEQHGTFSAQGAFDWDFNWVARSIDRLLDINSTLPPGRKLRVISISVGWSPGQKGYAETMAAVARATRDGVFVLSTALETTHGLKFHGLGRGALADPNLPESYGPGSWWSATFWGGQRRFAPGERLLVPMDARAVASPTGPSDYVNYHSGGWSWSVPWIAGLYALACEVRPELTPELFWSEAIRTGCTVRIAQAGESLEFGTIADPEALLQALRPGPP